MVDHVVVILRGYFVLAIFALFETGFVVVMVLVHHRLDGEDERGEAESGGPSRALPSPRRKGKASSIHRPIRSVQEEFQTSDLPEKRQADLAVLVQVRVETNCVFRGSHQTNTRRRDGVVRRTTKNEMVKAAFVGSILGPDDQNVHERELVLPRDNDDTGRRTLLVLLELND